MPMLRRLFILPLVILPFVLGAARPSNTQEKVDSLVTHGTDAFATAIRRGVELAAQAAEIVRRVGPPVRLVMEPDLSVVLFERDGWTRADWDAWAAAALDDGLAFVAPTTWRGRPAGRLVFLHPATDLGAVADLVARLR